MLIPGICVKFRFVSQHTRYAERFQVEITYLFIGTGSVCVKFSLANCTQAIFIPIFLIFGDSSRER